MFNRDKDELVDRRTQDTAPLLFVEGGKVRPTPEKTHPQWGLYDYQPAISSSRK